MASQQTEDHIGYRICVAHPAIAGAIVAPSRISVSPPWISGGPQPTLAQATPAEIANAVITLDPETSQQAQGGTFHHPGKAQAKKDCLDSEQVVRNKLEENGEALTPLTGLIA